MLDICTCFQEIVMDDHTHYTQNQITMFKSGFATLKSTEGLAALGVLNMTTCNRQCVWYDEHGIL